MKDIYSKPITDIEEFKLSDIITTSSGDGSGNNEPDTDVVWGQ